MRAGFRAVWLLFMIALVAAGAACSTKKQIKLEMTRETVITNPTIDSLSLDPAGKVDTRERGYTVEVTMTGDPGLDATFDVEGRFQGRAMSEVEPGIYVGSFNVAAGESGVPWVVGHLVHVPSGARQSLREGGALELGISAPRRHPAGECTEAMQAEFDAALRPLMVYFATGSYELDDEARTLLRENLTVLESHPPCVVYLLGHTDNSGEERLNALLSWERAMEVHRHLVTLGLPRYRIEAHYFGESQPAIAGEALNGLTRSRRVEFRAVNPY
jgi:outer membrane protein OmpA-like peptidoglycan-associated protein